MKKVLITALLVAMAYGEEIYATFDVQAIQSSKLGLNSSGIVKNVYVKIGDNVKKGDLLVELDSSKELLEVELAKNSIESAKLNFENTMQSFKRYEGVKDVIDDELFAKHQLDKNLKQNQLNIAKNELRLREDLLSKRKLFAPYSGVITDKNVEVGDSVMALSPVLSLINTPDVKLVLTFDEKYHAKVKKGEKFIYKIDGSDVKHEGYIEKIYPSVDKKSAKARAEVLARDIPVGIFGDGIIQSE